MLELKKYYVGGVRGGALVAAAAVAEVEELLSGMGCPLESTSKLTSIPRLKRSVARPALLLPLPLPLPLLFPLPLLTPNGESPDDSAPASNGDDPDRLITLLISGTHPSTGSLSLPRSTSTELELLCAVVFGCCCTKYKYKCSNVWCLMCDILGF